LSRKGRKPSPGKNEGTGEEAEMKERQHNPNTASTIPIQRQFTTLHTPQLHLWMEEHGESGLRWASQ
jgi:hypothetical protein